MKTLLNVLVVVSLALNLGLVGILLAGRAASHESPAAPAPKRAPAVSTPLVHAETWTGLQGGELAGMVQRLRDGGFPPAIVRAIVAAHLRDAYAARMRALDPGAENRPFWKFFSLDPRIRSAQHQLQREQQKILRDLLGADQSQESINPLYQGRRLDSVPAEKLDDVRRVLREHEDARNDLFASFGGGMIGPDMQKRMNALEAQQREALAQVLSPAELEDYYVRNSDTARQLRSNLIAFNPTEDEFRAIHRLQLAFDQEFGRTYYSPPTSEEMRRRSEAESQLRDQIKATLGPVRAADYEVSTDYSYRDTSRLVARLELPPETTGQVQAIKKDLEGRMREVLQSRPSSADREQALNAIAAEAQTKITALLGPRGYEAYQNHGGQWMRMMRQGMRVAPRP